MPRQQRTTARVTPWHVKDRRATTAAHDPRVRPANLRQACRTMARERRACRDSSAQPRVQRRLMKDGRVSRQQHTTDGLRATAVLSSPGARAAGRACTSRSSLRAPPTTPRRTRRSPSGSRPMRRRPRSAPRGTAARHTLFLTPIARGRIYRIYMARPIFFTRLPGVRTACKNSTRTHHHAAQVLAVQE